jgi:hypothetical protein
MQEDTATEIAFASQTGILRQPSNSITQHQSKSATRQHRHALQTQAAKRASSICEDLEEQILCLTNNINNSLAECKRKADDMTQADQEAAVHQRNEWWKQRLEITDSEKYNEVRGAPRKRRNNASGDVQGDSMASPAPALSGGTSVNFASSASALSGGTSGASINFASSASALSSGSSSASVNFASSASAHSGGSSSATSFASSASAHSAYALANTEGSFSATHSPQPFDTTGFEFISTLSSIDTQNTDLTFGSHPFPTLSTLPLTFSLQNFDFSYSDPLLESCKLTIPYLFSFAHRAFLSSLNAIGSSSCLPPKLRVQSSGF